jgi:hypothetical protein
MAILTVRDKNGNPIEIPALQGKTGKTAYQYAQEGGYEGTENEFMELLARAANNSKVEVSYKQTLEGGIKIGHLIVDGVTTDICAPAAGESVGDGNDNQTIMGNGTAFGDNAVINLVGSGATTVTADKSNNKITIHTPEVTDTGVRSWNDLEDRPFYETVQDLGDTITWDGTPNEDVVNFSGTENVAFYRISENVPTYEELVTGQINVLGIGDFAIQELTIETALPGLLVVAMPRLNDGAPLLAVNLADDFHFEMDGIALDIEKRGIYSIYMEDEDTDLTGEIVRLFVSSLTIPNYNFTKTDIKKLDPKYLPDGGVGYTVNESVKDTLTWDGTPTGVGVSVNDEVDMYLVSVSTPSPEELIGGSVSFHFNDGNGDGFPNDTDITEDIIQSNELITMVYHISVPAVLIVNEDGADVEGLIFPQKGIYFFSNVAAYTSSLTIPGYTFTKEVVHKIDEKYLPEHSWNNLKDRPFYDERYTGEGTYEFDGDLNGKETVVISDNNTYVKMSDIALTSAELENATYNIYDSQNGVSVSPSVLSVNDLSGELGVELYQVSARDNVYSMSYVFSLFEDIPEIGMTAGLWFNYYNSTSNSRIAYIQSMTYTGTVGDFKKLDPKYLEFSKTELIVDETVATGEEGEVGITGEGLFSTGFKLISGKTYLVEFAGVNYSCVARSVSGNGASVTWIGTGKPFDGNDSGVPFSIFQYSGSLQTALLTYTPDYANANIPIKIYQIDCVKIPKECLPDDIVGALNSYKETNDARVGVIEAKNSEQDTAIANIISGVTEVEYAKGAGNATNATNDGAGNNIRSTYELKTDARAKLNEAKEYADSLKDNLSESIVSESKEWTISDESGNIIAKVDADGLQTTQVSAKTIFVDGVEVRDRIPEVIDNLTSNSTTAALSAAQGKALKNAIDSITGDIGNLGGGDMMKASYDMNNNGIVDNAEKLEGHPASYFATEQDIDSIVDGETVVGVASEAVKAQKDSAGNIITDTYETKPFVIELNADETALANTTWVDIGSALYNGKVLELRCKDRKKYYRSCDYVYYNYDDSANILENELLFFVPWANHGNGYTFPGTKIIKITGSGVTVTTKTFDISM